eukprot:11361265-Prorocentrum_lima.AAC.1
MNIPNILKADAMCVEAQHILQRIAPDQNMIMSNHGLQGAKTKTMDPFNKTLNIPIPKGLGKK